MAIQSTFVERHVKGLPGMVASMDQYNIVSRICEVAAGIGFGLGVAQGSADNGIILQDATLTKFLGVTVKDPTQLVTATLVDKYPRYAEVAVLTLGKIWVQIYEDVTAGNAVYVDGVTGKFGDTDTSDSIGPITGARWENSGVYATWPLAILSLGLQK